MREEELTSWLTTKWAGRTFLYQEKTDSTNLLAKRLAKKDAVHGTLVCAASQSAGRGRRGREWISRENGNIYMSLLLRPKIQPEKAPMLTLIMAHSVARAMEETCRIQPGIKWPNDIVVGTKKVCGILTEMGIEEGKIAYVVIGIGINAGKEIFPEELKEKAMSLELKETEKERLAADCMNWFERDYETWQETGSLAFLKEEYEKFLVNKNKMVCVMEPGREYKGRAVGITDTGELLVEKETGEVVTVYSGEVSVRGIYGYV